MKNIRPRDPVLLGICSQSDLDKLLNQANLNNNAAPAKLENDWSLD